MIGVGLEPVDTWFFRDGTPFTRGAAPQEDVESLFPPHPTTVVGALRAALALARGWSGRGSWCEAFNDVLGDGPEDLGVLSFDGPFLLRDGRPLFPVPRHLLGITTANGCTTSGWQPCALLRPGPPVRCDLGEAVRLPDLPEGGGTSKEQKRPFARTAVHLPDLPEGGGIDGKPHNGDRQWLTLKGLTTVLRGGLPETKQVVPSGDLWSVEERIGLQRDRETRSAMEGRLYSTRQVRPGRGVSLGMRISGLPAGWADPFGQLVPLGGESRLAHCREWTGGTDLDALPAAIGSDGRAALVALSPLDLEDAIVRGERPLDGLGGARIVSACLDRPQHIGGWNSLAHRPLPLRSALAPGTVLFCEIPDDKRDAIATGGLLRIGARTAQGFGLVAAGAWPED